MSDTPNTGVSRRQLLEAAGTAVAAVAAAGLAAPAEAATPQTMPFKATFTVKFQTTMIPVHPPIVSQGVTGAGQADLLGAVTVAAYRRLQLDPDGNFWYGGADPGVFTAANGDAVFWVTKGVVGGAGGFFITGGKGRFCGATGRGTIPTQVDDPAKGETTFTWDGTITIPQ
jgi:hypothetical protein